MEYTKEQLNDMQEYLVGQLKLHSSNNTYPKTERTLNLLLVMLADQRVDASSKQNASQVEDE